MCSGSIYLQTGRDQQDIPEIRRAQDLSKHGVLELRYLGHDLRSWAGGEAQKALDELKGLSRKRYVPAEHIALAYEGTEDRDHALEWLEKAYARAGDASVGSDGPRLNGI